MPANSTQPAGASNLPVLQFQVTNPGTGPLTLTSVTLTALGSGNDAGGIVSVDLYWDQNGNGLVDAGEGLLATGSYGADNGNLVLNFTDVLAAGQSQNLLVVEQLSAAAGTGTFQSILAGPGALTGVNAAGAVAFTGTPLNGAVITLAAATLTPTPVPVVSVIFSPPSPNPSTEGAPIRVDLKAPGPMTLEWAVFTSAFRKIHSGSQSMGTAGFFQWDLKDRTGTPAARGVYYLRLVVQGDFGLVTKIFKVIVL